MAREFSKGDEVRCIKFDLGALLPGELAFLRSKATHVVERHRPSSTGGAVYLEGQPTGYSPERFELVRSAAAVSAAKPQEIAVEFEVRWRKPDGTGNQGVTDGRVLTRRNTQEQAEEFVKRNYSNYAVGDFEIVKVTTQKVSETVRRVRAVTEVNLVDA